MRPPRRCESADTVNPMSSSFGIPCRTARLAVESLRLRVPASSRWPALHRCAETTRTTGSTFCPAGSDCSARSTNRISSTGYGIPSMRQIFTAVVGQNRRNQRRDHANVLGRRIQHGVQLILRAFGLALRKLPGCCCTMKPSSHEIGRPDFFERPREVELVVELLHLANRVA